MGFGSYDESEQENQQVDEDESDGEGVTVQQNKHDGEVSFESDQSADDLIDRLQDMKDEDEEE
jgi:hypothetical protein